VLVLIKIGRVNRIGRKASDTTIGRRRNGSAGQISAGGAPSRQSRLSTSRPIRVAAITRDVCPPMRYQRARRGLCRVPAFVWVRYHRGSRTIFDWGSLAVSLRVSGIRPFFSRAGKYAATAVIVILTLSGCSQRWGEHVDADVVACQGYGFYYGTPEYDECIKYVDRWRAKGAAPLVTPAPSNVICQTQSSGTIDCQAR
jgi:hypothetical protein